GAYQSWSVAGDAKLDADRVREMMDGLGEAIVRAKGILWVASDPDQRTVYQRVGARGSFSTAGRWDGAAPRSSLVVIGLRSALQQPELERRFDACRAGLSP
ncbi:MAG: cobalamin biosynthesis protein CobW, partial [Betaproteobacteria bacterium]|nr:cobalamin biosynthesis protein CobW [Betaproteobacteria bacterium]